ncbi:urease accessory protein UreD [Chitinophagaceae bacterium LB-8]|uniref:Urease accessory protein UreD n=1 Tax=Paraflavisolibacter caeni TaxID=2982496 RepID=A0A9X2XVB6_9BACT|nr:urease accessory protein UreD [Paraflavisolibacter caeni]MCU7549630.1 urease accessory protein UreD [Paraflavisolibacter caeni]
MNGELHIATGRKNGRTFLKSVYNTPPFKLANITINRTAEKLQLMIMSASPGVLDGDRYNIKVELAEATAVEIKTQSYQRLFQMKTGAVQTMEVYMADISSLSYLPHPIVPHKSSSFTSHNRIFLSAGCSLIWGEVLTCGRQLNGESFSFTRYHNKTEIFQQGKLIVKENLFLQPAVMNVGVIGQMEGYTHQASFIFINEKVNTKDLYNEISGLLSREQDVCFGVSLLPVNGLTVRLLGYKGEQLHNCLEQIAQLIESRMNQDHSPFTKSRIYAE